MYCFLEIYIFHSSRVHFSFLYLVLVHDLLSGRLCQLQLQANLTAKACSLCVCVQLFLDQHK